MFQAYREAGYCVIPLKSGVPAVKWGQYQTKLPEGTEAEEWDKNKAYKEIALVCGSVSSVIALDIDTDDVEIINRVESAAGISPVKKIGSKGFTAFYKYNGEKTQRWGNVIEILSDKHLTTLPPSKHRSKNLQYTWDNPARDLLGNDLPALGQAFYSVMDSLYPRKEQPALPAYPRSSAERNVELDEAAKMLDCLSPDCAREEWVVIGMALKSAFGDIACSLWHSWSAKSSGKYNIKDAQSAWRSFNGSGITIGTLIHKAKQNGFVFTLSLEAAPAEAVREITPEEVAHTRKKKKRPEPLKVGGLIGEIADWITETAIRKQPMLSLSAALVFAGMMKGHRIRGRTNLRTNIMTLSLAPSAAGKDHAHNCIDRLAEACGLGKHLMGRPVSGTGLLTGLNKCGGVGLLNIDEMGRYIANITMKNAGGFQREICDYMVELFSAAGRTFRGRQYGNEQTNPQIIIKQPHLCCLGSTVQERLQAACSSVDVIDGFLNRWLVFSTEDRPEKDTGIRFMPIPEEIVAHVIEWMNANPLKSDNYGTPQPKEVRFSPEAWDMLVSFDRQMVRKLSDIPYPVNQLYVRSAEHAEKVSMVLCDDDYIGASHLRSAIEIVHRSNEFLYTFSRGIADTPHDANTINVLKIIKMGTNAVNAGYVSKREITRATQGIPQRARVEIIAQLVDSEQVEIIRDGNKTVYRYIGDSEGSGE